MIGKTIDQLAVGEIDQFTKTISESDIYLYAGITGDLNPAHINEEYAKGTFFKTRIAHGILIGGLISTVIGTKLPGPGSIYREQHLKFIAPVHIGDTITARVEIKEIVLEKNKVILQTSCFNQDGAMVVDGNAIISPPKNKNLTKEK
ncbi:MAG: MaoC family dehydratase [Pseudomonadota bacterium]